MAVGVAAPYANALPPVYGDGSAGKPYRIGSCAQLNGMPNLAAHYQLVRSIDCDGFSFTPIGSPSTPFEGELDGKGYSIDNLTISGTDNVGLFGAITSGTVKNLGINLMTLSGHDNVGSLAGVASLASIQSVRIHSTSITATGNKVGGMIGQLGGSTLQKASATNVFLSGNQKVGGLVGDTVGPSSISDAFAVGEITGSVSVGGLSGTAGPGPVQVSHTYANVHVTSTGSNVGGLIGLVANTGGLAINNSFSVSQLDDASTATHVGGALGDNAGSTTNLYFDQDRSGLSTCVGSGSASCTAVNLTGADSNHFKNNHTDAPLNGWDFDTTWQQQVNDYPELQPLFHFAEDNGPNGNDANDDGINDIYQPTVSSLPDGSGAWSTVEIPTASNNCTIDAPSVHWERPVQTDTKADWKLHSMTGFSVYCGGSGVTLPVTIIYDRILDPARLVLRYFNETTHKYSTVSGAVFGTRTIGSATVTTVTYNITDGGTYDADGLTNGIIVDPVIPATLAATSVDDPTVVGMPNTGLASQSMLPLLAALMVSVTGLYIIYKRHAASNS